MLYAWMKMPKNKFNVKNKRLVGAGEMTQRLRAPAALTEAWVQFLPPMSGSSYPPTSTDPGVPVSSLSSTGILSTLTCSCT